jgi:hypothetical protein
VTEQLTSRLDKRTSTSHAHLYVGVEKVALKETEQKGRFVGRRLSYRLVELTCMKISGEARGFKVAGGLRGRYGRGEPPPAGGPGIVPPEKFSNYRCTQVSFSAFFIQKLAH